MSNDLTRDLRQALADEQGREPKLDVAHRIAVLLGDDDAVYVDAGHHRSRKTTWWTGVVLTEDRVIHASAYLPDDLKPIATVATWARRTLISAEIEERIALPDATQAERNSASTWSAAGPEWPKGAVLSLTYPAAKLVLPLRQDAEARQQFRHLLPDLLADVTR
ncbi:hypothetical protein [Lentzea sp. NPDC003310]|uniref:hypothetical protein n=1 Tax=Lentzea sp. NPDC003310 TaxID=3154447 RepID=UPI0033A82C43